ncbi:D-alanyl-D-alanine carboxypeptidase-like protein [Williamsia muralis]|nr:D-alanyl-D-alanine carboxypeptidase-like protein [Williamsia marianensis]
MFSVSRQQGAKMTGLAVAAAVAALSLGGGVAQASPETTMNGHPVIPLESTIQWNVEGTNFWTAPGDATTILQDFVSWFSLNIESLNEGGFDEWSWAEPELVGPTYASYSNHGSATAVDVNAQKHPQGERGTFSDAQTSAIRAKVAQAGGRLVWGGDWADLPDETHFELAPLLR